MQAQTDLLTILYTNAQEGIVYQRDNSDSKLFPGSSLPVDGILILEEGVFANILYKEKKKRLDGPAKFNVQEICASLDEEKKRGFLGRFWAYLSNSVSNSPDKENLEKYHKEYLTNATAATEAFGEGSIFESPLYLSEIFGNERVRFNWSSEEVFRSYRIELSHESGDLIASVLVKNPSFELDFSSMALVAGQVYNWRIIAYGKETIKTDSIPFFYDPFDIKQYVKDVQSSKEFESLSEQEQDLYVIFALEDELYYHPAYARYKDLLNKHPENILYKKLFAAFLVRMNALDEANDLLDN